jgi:hypothetical protein
VLGAGFGALRFQAGVVGLDGCVVFGWLGCVGVLCFISLQPILNFVDRA